MATPKQRTSPHRSGNRRRNIGITLPSIAVCPDCKKTMVSHRACPHCGRYRGRQVIAASR